jgi:malate dehydrogenase (oxaloacetate-decarboxylating)
VAKLIAPTVGAINIEDVAAPRTFTVVRRLQEILDIPVICDDQHGSAVVVMAGLINSLEIVGKDLKDIKIVIFGAGAAGIESAELLLYAGARNIVALNSQGILGPQNPSMNYIQEELSQRINPEGLSGGLEEAVKGADVLIGFSGKGKFTADHIRSMNKDSIVFALSLPDPEIRPEEAKAAGARIFACGLNECVNAMPNLHAYPGIARGLMEVKAKGINNNVLIKAAEALASVVDRRRLSENRIIPELVNDEETPRVAEAVAQAVISEGLALIKVPPKQIYDETWQRLYGGHLARI